MVEVRGLELRFENAGQGVRVGFPRALNRVLLNLTTNAVKNTDRGSVRVAARPTLGGKMEFSVTDTGHGFSPGELTHTLETSPLEDEKNQRLTAFPAAGKLPLAAINALAEKERWHLAELHLESGRLDEVFRSITGGATA